MKVDKKQAGKLIRDGVISLVLYALPVVLMLLWFHLRGEHPWRH